jgi:hypothetical protein
MKAELRTVELISVIAAIQDSNLAKLKSMFYPNQKIQFIRETHIPLPENRQDALQVVDMALALSEVLEEWDDPRKLDGSLSVIEKLLTMKNPKAEPVKKACHATKADGSPCAARTQEGQNFCFFHDPEKADKRRAAQARGGEGNRALSLPIDMPEFNAETVGDLRPLYLATINQVLRRELSPNAATAICNLANGLSKTLEDRDLRQRLRDLE